MKYGRNMETHAQQPIHGTLMKNARRGTAGKGLNLHKKHGIGRQFAPVDRRTARLERRVICTITALSGGSLRPWTDARRGTACTASNLHKNGVTGRQFAPVDRRTS